MRLTDKIKMQYPRVFNALTITRLGRHQTRISILLAALFSSSRCPSMPRATRHSHEGTIAVSTNAGIRRI